MERLNVVEIDTHHGYRQMELFSADLGSWEIEADVLVVSAFAGDYSPVEGTLIETLRDAYAIDLEKESKRPAFDLRDGFGCWVTRELADVCPFRRILIVEMTYGESPPLASINNVFATLAAVEAKGLMHHVVAMPVIGTGSQGLAPADVIPVVLHECERALHRQEHLQVVKFVERDGTRAGHLSNAMDDALDRPGISLPRGQVIEALQRDLANAVARAAEFVPQSNKPFLQELHQLSVADGQPSYAVGVTARKLVEMVVHDVVPDAKKNQSLMARIGALQQLGVSPWITSYMHTLRTFGNEGAHEQPHGRRVPPHVVEDDVAIALFCAVRILAFWHELRQGAPFEVAARDSASLEQ